MQNSNQNSENESLPFACNESKRKIMFKFRDDEEDERKTIRYSDKEKSLKVFSGRLNFLIGFGNSACVCQVDEKLITYKTISKK